jgi:NTE family protein
MAVQINGEPKRIGLALSGGGFRAAAFHLGTFLKLRELKLLDKVDVLTCVSGGSIAGAFLAANWNSADVLDRLENYLRTRSIAVSTVIGGMFDPFHSRLDKLAAAYDRDLFNGGTLTTLRKGPRIYLNSTSLSTGNMFTCVAGEQGRCEIGEWELGFHEDNDFPISRAVAASSAFPPVFPPLRVDRDKYPVADVDYVTLTDGGVYDNLGVNPLFRERNNVHYAIVSDAGKPFAIDETPTDSGTIVLKETISILMEQVRGLQFERLRLAYKAQVGPKPLWYSIDSGAGEQQPGDAVFASAISTGLSKLGDAEMRILKRHAGSLLHHRIKNYAPELLG